MDKPLLLLFSLALLSCVREPEWTSFNDNSDPMEQMSVDPGFDYKTTELRTFSVVAKDAMGNVLRNVPVYLLNELPENGGVQLAMGQTDEQGEWHFAGSLPENLSSLILYTPYPGLPDTYKVTLEGSSTTAILGGNQMNQERNIQVVDNSNLSTPQPTGSASHFSQKYRFLSTYNSLGVPNNLAPVRDYIPQDLLDFVARALPENGQVPINNPGYIAESVSTETILRDSAEIYVTFVHEGTRNRNALGYYTYDLNNPPASADQIDSLYVVFPNVSYLGGGGGLRSGDKVKIGKFAPNTGIGWFLVPQGWNGTTVLNASEIKFSNKAFNTFTNTPNRPHVALLKDSDHNILLLGMEDVTRPGSDNDFNDAVFYVTASPYAALATENLAQARVAFSSDLDGDGVPNVNDAYPNDPDRAFNINLPGTGVYGSVAFEDQWPHKGDYDMNDLVVDYSYTAVTNAANEVVDLKCAFLIQAIGASLLNGFGISLEVPAQTVASVTGTQLFGNIIQLAANGVEAGQSKAVIIAFDNAHLAMGQQPGKYVNCEIEGLAVAPKAINLTITFAQPQNLTDLGEAPFNPFIFTGRGRGYEVHLVDQAPTDLANTDLFRTGDDNTIPSQNRYYKDKFNLPFAIHTPQQFAYPVNGQAIVLGHLKFADWAQSSGANYPDWYADEPGYRNPAKLYRQ